jgi:hypothetical protein
METDWKEASTASGFPGMSSVGGSSLGVVHGLVFGKR